MVETTPPTHTVCTRGQPTFQPTPRYQQGCGPPTVHAIGKAWKKPSPSSPILMSETCKKNPKSHTDTRNLQKKPPPSPILMLANMQLCLDVVAAPATCHLHVCVHSLQVKSSVASMQQDGSAAVGRCGGAVSYPTKTQADVRTVLGWVAEPCLRGQVPQSCVQPELGCHQKGCSGTVLP